MLMFRSLMNFCVNYYRRTLNQKIKANVETIQKEQDCVIHDMENYLMMV